MLKGFPIRWGGTAISAVALTMSCYHLYVAFVGPPDAQIFRSVHLAFVVVIAYLLLPASGRREPGANPNVLDLILLAATLAATLYPIFYYDYLVNRMYYVDDLYTSDLVFGIALSVLLLEATRRAVGWALPATAAAFIGSALYAGFGLDILVDQLYLTTEGIFGIPLSVSATYIVLFIIFGALVERSGAGRLFMDFAMSLTGHTAGGPAKVACVTSGLFGSVSGSAVANVMTTGVYTIPLMQRIG
jgi:TRAP-type uncharacterized transport system fused permease subunit